MVAYQLIADCGDNLFGPNVLDNSCRSGFDFTLLFEETVFAIGPSALLLLSVPWRVAQLYKGRVKVTWTAFHIIKLTTIAVYACLQLVLLILWSSSSVPTTKATVACASVNLVCSLALGLLSHFEHSRSARPSFILNVYLLLSLLLDIARARTQWLLTNNPSDICLIFTIAVVLKSIILVLEATEKRRLLLQTYRHISRESTSGILNRSVFWWLNSLLMKGAAKILSPKDLFAIDEALDSASIGASLTSVWNKGKKEGKHALFFTIARNFQWPILSLIVPRLCVLGLTLSQPFLVEEAISFASTPDDQQTQDVGYGLIGAYAFVYIGHAVFTGLYQQQIFRIITMIRGGLVYMIYGKMIDLKIGNIDESAAMTLMSTDVEQIANSLQFVSDVWADLIQVVCATYLLERQIGIACISPLIVGIAFSLVTLYVSRYIFPFQKAWLNAIQNRVNVTSEALGVMKGVKFAGLTDKLTTIIQSLRIKELDISLAYRKLRVTNTVMANAPTSITPVLTFTVYALIQRSQSNGGTLDISKAFTSLSILYLLIAPCGTLIFAISELKSAAGCFRRIQEYLREESRQDHRLLAAGVTPISQTPSPDGIELQAMDSYDAKQTVLVQNGNFGWTDSEPILHDINLRLDSPLTLIIGPVASGKSTLLSALAGETPSSKGFVYVSSLEAAFCEQTSWITNGTIRENIVGASTYDPAWYTTVIHACALRSDLQQLPLNDLSPVGSKGITLSGGQRQRIAIARAVYARKRIAIFDDVLSGLDAGTEETVFNNIFGPDGLLRKTNTMSILVTHAVHRIPYATYLVVLENGRITEQGSYDRLKSSAGYVGSLKLRETSKSDEITVGKTPASISADPHKAYTQLPNEDLTRQTGDLSIYKYYAKSIGYWNVALFVIYVAVHEVFLALPQLWLNWWAEANTTNAHTDLGYWLGIYGLFAGLSLILLCFACYQLNIVMAPVSAKALHWTVLKTVMKARMSFFDTTDTGITTNRFSQDMQLIDLTLPSALINTSFQVGSVIGAAVLTSIATKYLAISMPLIGVILYMVQKFYLRTSRQLRLLDLEAKSPLYSHFIESLNGLVTLRAFGWSQPSIQKNIHLLDASQKPYYLLFSIQRWLNFVLDMLVACLAIALMSLTVLLKGKVSPGFLGIALVQVMDIGQVLSQLIGSWTLLETSLGAIARVKSFAAETPGENLPGENQPTPESWPQQGHVTFDRVSASYGGNSPPVLDNISFSITAGEKIGIVGRSGSGKSSLLLTLFRMLDLDSGVITVDNIDISTISRQDTRERLIAMPQDPFFLNGTVRLNADPMEQCDDKDIETALRKVGLWEVVLEKGGLEVDMHADFLSHGQRQLFCLARAILRKSTILVLDEVSSSVDSKTDQMMQKLIREEFKGYTILAVAHRLDTLMDFDKIVVLDGGKLVDFDSPTRLLERPSIFRDLYHA